MCEHSCPETDEHAVAVDAGDAAVCVDGVHQCATDDGQDAAGGVPGHVIPKGRHDSTVCDDGEYHEEDEREEADAGFEGGVISCELEEDGNHVDWDEDRCSASGSHAEEDKYGAGLEELNGEDAAGGSSEDRVDLLDAEDDEEYAGADEEPDDLAAIPRVGDATEGDGHDARDEGADGDDAAEVVHFAGAVHEGDAWAGVFVREHEDIHGGANGADT